MNKQLLTLSFIVAAALSFAEMKLNPDSNTLWIEDGKDIKTSTNNYSYGFNNTDIIVTSNPDGGFYMEQKKQGKPRSGRMVSISPEYPYLVYEIDSLEQKPGYHALWMPLIGSGMMVMEGNPQKGVFAINVYENSKLDLKKKQSPMSFDIHGLKVGFKYVKMVKTPDYYIKVESPAFAKKKYCAPGDKVKFTVFLKEEAEDVSLTFYNRIVTQVSINGSSKLQLYPVNKNQKVWSREITLESVKYRENFVPSIKAVILGSENAPDALWGKPAYPFHIK